MDIKFYADRSNEKKHQLSIQGDNSVTAIKGFFEKKNLLDLKVFKILKKKGVAVMKSLKFIYNPNSNITLKITASNILKFYSEFLDSDKKVYEINDNQIYDYMLNINFRPCVEGEIYRSESDMYTFFKQN